MERQIDENFINTLVEIWEEDTMHLSVHDMSHPSILLINNLFYKYPKLVISSILEDLKKRDSWEFIILARLIPSENKPNIPEKSMGNLPEMKRIWLDWGKRKRYIE